MLTGTGHIAKIPLAYLINHPKWTAVPKFSAEVLSGAVTAIEQFSHYAIAGSVNGELAVFHYDDMRLLYSIPMFASPVERIASLQDDVVGRAMRDKFVISSVNGTVAMFNLSSNFNSEYVLYKKQEG